MKMKYEFETYILGVPYEPSDEEATACKAFHEYEEKANQQSKGHAKLMREISEYYDVPTSEIVKHRRCYDHGRKCFE